MYKVYEMKKSSNTLACISSSPRVFALLEMVPIKLLELSPLARFTHLTYDKIYTQMLLT